MARPLYPQHLCTTRAAMPLGVAGWLNRLVLDEQSPSISQRIIHGLRIARELQDHRPEHTSKYVLSFALHSRVWYGWFWHQVPMLTSVDVGLLQ